MIGQYMHAWYASALRSLSVNLSTHPSICSLSIHPSIINLSDHLSFWPWISNLSNTSLHLSIPSSIQPFSHPPTYSPMQPFTIHLSILPSINISTNQSNYPPINSSIINLSNHPSIHPPTFISFKLVSIYLIVYSFKSVIRSCHRRTDISKFSKFEGLFAIIHDQMWWIALWFIVEGITKYWIINKIWLPWLLI